LVFVFAKSNKKAQREGESALGFFNKIENDRFSGQNKKPDMKGRAYQAF
jgi:hypothetical protein